MRDNFWWKCERFEEKTNFGYKLEVFFAKVYHSKNNFFWLLNLTTSKVRPTNESSLSRERNSSYQNVINLSNATSLAADYQQPTHSLMDVIKVITHLSSWRTVSWTFPTALDRVTTVTLIRRRVVHRKRAHTTRRRATAEEKDETKVISVVKLHASQGCKYSSEIFTRRSVYNSHFMHGTRMWQAARE